MAQKEITRMLEDDHKTVDTLLERLEKARKTERRQGLLAELKKEVLIHKALEEELFYPEVDKALKTKKGHMMILEANEEHALVEKALSDLEEAPIDSDEFVAKTHVLKEIITHHVKEEENELFPKVRKALKKERLQRMGAEMATRKEEVETAYDREGTIPARH